jgi:hypothetical protein
MIRKPNFGKADLNGSSGKIDWFTNGVPTERRMHVIVGR